MTDLSVDDVWAELFEKYHIGHNFVKKTILKMPFSHRPYPMTNGYRVYNDAMERIYGEWIKKPCGGRDGPLVWKFSMPNDVDHGQVLKTRKGKKLESMGYTHISGHVPDEYLNKSAVERINLTIRNRMASFLKI